MNDVVTRINVAIENKDALAARDIAINELLLSSGDHQVLYDTGIKLWTIGKSHDAKILFNKAFEIGFRDPEFLRSYAGLLTGEMDFHQLFVAFDSNTTTDNYIEMLVGHGKLAQKFQRNEVIAKSIDRESSEKWLSPERLIEHVLHYIHNKKPMSLVRLGDGEARFVLYAREINSTNNIIDKNYVRLIGDNVWSNWFGESIEHVGSGKIENLYSRYMISLNNADILGVVDSNRIRCDTSHFGYIAYQDELVSMIDRNSNFLCDSLIHYSLNKISPFLECFFTQIDSFSTISPHPDLAEKIGKYYGIANFHSYIIPGERRLPPSYFEDLQNRHFPGVYEQLCANLVVRTPGELFIVAAGLLGKIYCDVIKQKGGIALDIGSIVDGWMGINTRPGYLDGAEQLV